MATRLQVPEPVAAKSGGCGNQCEGCGCSADVAGKAAAARPTIREVKKILVAVDHTGHAALAMALTLAGPLHAEVAVIHVFDAVTIVSADNAFTYTATTEQLRNDAKNMLKQVEAGLPDRAKAFTCLREGNTADEIISAAQEWGADLIVMGTHRKSVVSRAFLGSTSQGVLRHGKCPVLLVDDAAKVDLT